LVLGCLNDELFDDDNDFLILRDIRDYWDIGDFYLVV
jgi:hypothetical protein